MLRQAQVERRADQGEAERDLEVDEAGQKHPVPYQHEAGRVPLVGAPNTCCPSSAKPNGGRAIASASMDAAVMPTGTISLGSTATKSIAMFVDARDQSTA